MTKERITVTLPKDIVRDIDRREKNRSKFIFQAVRNELNRQKREELRRSLKNPHPESRETEDLGMDVWIGQSTDGDEDLLDPSVGRAVQWSPGKGWIEGKK
jgi:Arc/MetJ-type ribon-helix-helix transcriptional regulator